ncbi:unnamed protein product, partial [Allacma fusca]
CINGRHWLVPEKSGHRFHVLIISSETASPALTYRLIFRSWSANNGMPTKGTP